MRTVRQRTKHTVLFLTAVFLCATTLAPTLRLYAAVNGQGDTKGITISPPLKEVVLGPGLLEAHIKISISNTTGSDVSVNLRLVDFEAANEFGAVTFSPSGAPSPKYGLVHWMSLTGGDTLTIPNGKTADIPVKINNSSDLSPGGHYGAVIASVKGPTNAGSNTVGLTQEIVSLLFVKKLGGEKYGLELTDLKAVGSASLLEEVSLRFKSTGNVHVVPRGYVEVTDSKGKLVAKGIINPESTLVMPDTSRQFVTIMQPIANANRGGKYKVTAYYRYDEQAEFSSKSIFFTRPLASGRTFVIVIAGISAVSFGLFVWLRRRKRSRKNRSIQTHDIGL